ncbi:MAG: hypothetical protein NVV62_19045 [Terricaulis sp.]|nr:hypothetical protein [Terricaulis sp.]
MTKLDLVLARIRQLPPERQEAVALYIDLILQDEESGSVFTDEEWADIEPTLDEGGPTMSHEEFAAEIRSKYPG